MDLPKATVEMLDFPGLILNVDRRDLPPGAADEQINLVCLNFGQLSVRRGYREVTFEN